jgi:hypothetical protein
MAGLVPAISIIEALLLLSEMPSTRPGVTE